MRNTHAKLYLEEAFQSLLITELKQQRRQQQRRRHLKINIWEVVTICDYFFFLAPLLLTEHAAYGPVEAPLN